MASVEEVITNKIIDLLEKGTVPWRKPWAGGEMPKNLVNKKEYRGINTFILSAMGFRSPYWLSFKQTKVLGGSVKKGEHGTPVIFWKWLTVEDKDRPGHTKEIPLLRYYTVFNVDQIEDLSPAKIPALSNEFNENEKLERCEYLLFNMPNKPEIRHKEQRAYYSPLADFVNMPNIESFVGSAEYYSTLFHELIHSTGHEKRLNRKGVSGSDGEWSAFGSTPYAKEELVAEMGAAFLCGYCQIENNTVDNSAAYIASWLQKLRNDKKMVVYAAASAQKAADYIRGIES